MKALKVAIFVYKERQQVTQLLLLLFLMPTIPVVCIHKVLNMRMSKVIEGKLQDCQ
uniref:Uncharacterized protein n=1 Tax=Arundo donax TaxID=35708 RepID=A0A0A8YBV5_ARUDO